MDTDNLSNETYKAIFLESEKFNDDLTLQFGLLAGTCKTESEFLGKAKETIEEIKTLSDAALSDIFFGSPPDRVKLLQQLETLLANIEQVDKIPLNERHYDF